MKKITLLTILAVFGAVFTAHAQQSDVVIQLMQGDRATIAVPDLRGGGAAEPMMGTVNGTLFSELQESGLFRMAPKSMYPMEVPQRPQDFVLPGPPQRAGEEPVRRGPWLTDWSRPPVSANYVTIGYAAEQTGRLVLFGWLYNVNQPNLENAQVFGKLYFGDMNEDGARKVAREFAADILAQFGQESMLGSKIYFVSNRSGAKEIWSMEYDGSNQQQLTRYGSTSIFPAVSPDGTKVIFTTYAEIYPMLYVHSLETGRRLPFLNQQASMNATAEFTPDGQKVFFSSTAAGKYAQIYSCSPNGSGLQRITYSNAIDVEPTINPKNPDELVIVSGRSGLPQIYKMSVNGTNVVRLSTGEGEAVNPGWHRTGSTLHLPGQKDMIPVITMYL